jgi:hypothetical protein
MKNLKSDNNFVASAWLVLGVIARVIPHPANVSPMTSISLFGGAKLSRGMAFLLTFATLIASDLLLSLVYGHEAFGPWTFFTYSGFAAIVFAGSFLKNSAALRTIGFLLGSSLFFWLWTNFGIWATGQYGLYPRNLEGLVACYVAALPFLRNALLGDLAWGAVFFLGFEGVRALAPRFGWALARS